MNELFSMSELRQPLTLVQKTDLINRIIRNARYGFQYMYGVREAAGMMHISYDEIQTLLKFYRLDCIVIRGTIIRIPWWSFAEYLIDPAEDMETALYDYLKSLPQKHLENQAGNKKNEHNY